MSKRSNVAKIETKKKKQRKAITLEKKYEIISNHEAGVTVKDLCAKYSLSSSTVCTILKDKDKYLNEAKNAHSMQSTWLRTKDVDSVIPHMEKLLTAWISEQTRKLDMPVTYATICVKALSIFKMLKDQKGGSCKETFVASSGWFDRYKRRAGLHNIKAQEENETADRLLVEVSMNDVFDMLQANNEELENERLLEMEKSDVEAENNASIRSFTVQGLEEAFQNLEKAIEIFESQDLNFERSSRVATDLQNSVACYREIYNEKKRMACKKIEALTPCTVSETTKSVVHSSEDT